MKEWLLVVVIGTGAPGASTAIDVVSVGGFGSRDACLAAGFSVAGELQSSVALVAAWQRVRKPVPKVEPGDVPFTSTSCVEIAK